MIGEIVYAGSLPDADELARFLGEHGFSPEAAQAKAILFAACASALPSPAGFVPGRIEVLGKHTDYAGGSSIVAAAERGCCAVFLPRDDNAVIIADHASGETARFAMRPDLGPGEPAWSNYPRTVARRIARNFPDAHRGADIVFASDLPRAAGMSSSSALMVATFLALAEVNGVFCHPLFPPKLHDPLELAAYLGAVENGQDFGPLAGDRGVGTFGGSEDHAAILYSQAGHLRQYAYCPIRVERTIPMPAGHTFAIAASGVAAEKTGAAREQFNRASRLAAELAALWRRSTGRDDQSLGAALASAPDAADRLRRIVSSAVESSPDGPFLLARLEHFIAENQHVIPAAGDALVRGDLPAFGEWVDRSQQAAERLLGNQISETSFLAAEARRLGAVAASAFGAGFGGSVWALVPAAGVEDFAGRWRRHYASRFPAAADQAAFFPAAAGRPALLFRAVSAGAA